MESNSLMFVLSLAISLSRCGSQCILPNSAFLGTGGNITLTCQHPSGTKVRWARGRLGSLSAIDDPRLVETGSELFIGQFRGSDHAGWYSCIVEPLEEGMAHTVVSCPVEVQHARIPAGFAVQPENTTASEGSSVVLQCSPHPSVPAPVIVWTHNGQYLHAPGSPDQYYLAPSGNLHIRALNSSNEGVYRCKATNPVTGARRRSREVVLRVEAAEVATEAPSTYAVEPRNVVAVEGSRLVLECAGQGYPKSLAAWNLPLYLRVNGPDWVQVAVGVVLIDSLSRAHAGQCSCYLFALNNNSLSFLAMRTIELTVRVQPRLTATPPPQLTMQQGTNISCSANASDSMELFILHNGTILQAATGKDLNVQASPPSDQQGSYTFQCLAFNEYGCDNREFTVTFINETMPTDYIPGVTTPTNPIPTDVTTPTNPIPTDATSICPVPGETTPTRAIPGDATPTEPTTDATTPTEPITNDATPTDLIHDKITPTADTEGSGTTPLTPPSLDLQATSGLIQAHVGDHRIAVCEATGWVAGSAPLDLTITWAQGGGSRDLDSDPVDGISVTSAQVGWTLISYLVFQAVQEAHNGSYTCRAAIQGLDLQMTATVTLVVLGDTPTTESHVTSTTSHMNRSTTTDSEITTSETDQPTLFPPSNLQVKRDPVTYGLEVTWDDPHNSKHSIEGFKLNWDKPGVIGKVAREYINAEPAGYRFVIPGTLYDWGESLVVYVWVYSSIWPWDGPLAEVEISPPDPITEAQCDTTIMNPTHLLVGWPESFTDGSSSINIVFRCAQARSHFSITLAPPPSHAHHNILDALPNCDYTVQMLSAGKVATCTVSTPSGHVDWMSTPSLVVPAPSTAPSTETAGDSSRGAEVALVYGLIFGGVAVGCGILVAIILALKYVQWSRRDSDKVTNFREKSYEEFQRKSFQRSSTTSAKSSKSTAV